MGDITTIEEYLQKTSSMFDVMTNNTVLEIATGIAMYWPYYELNKPSSITGLDPDTRWQLPESFKGSIIREDAFNYLSKKIYYDVIVCYGLIYKLHSPIDLFEKICRCKPRHVCIETTNSEGEMTIIKTHHNRLGELVTNDLTSRYALLLTNQNIIDVFDDLGYQLTKKQHLKSNLQSKENVVQMNFDRKN